MLKSSSYHSAPSFIRKIYEMVSNEDNHTFVCWTTDGKSMLISDEEIFSKEILPKYFKHSNYCSFVRQLNMYSFHKVRQSEHPICFAHQCFRKGQIENLGNIKRKPEKKKGKQQPKSIDSIFSSQKKIAKETKPNNKKVSFSNENQQIMKSAQNTLLKQQNFQYSKSPNQKRQTLWESSVSISGDLVGQNSPRISVFGDLQSPRNYFSPINFDAFICSYRNIHK